MQNVTLYTDGAARGNPDGPGGYGAVLQFVDSQGNLLFKMIIVIFCLQKSCQLHIVCCRKAAHAGLMQAL